MKNTITVARTYSTTYNTMVRPQGPVTVGKERGS
jgi:hypothetical protein